MLIAADDDDFAALIGGGAVRGLVQPPGGIESAETLAMLRDLAAAIRPGFASAAWLIREGGEVAGLVSIVAVPVDGVVTIGYGIAAERRGRGLARRAIADIVAWAGADVRVSALAAATGTANLASQRVLAVNGFARIGTEDDPEDGPRILWRHGIGRSHAGAIPVS